MRQLLQATLCLALGVCVALGAVACKKQVETTSATPQTYQHLPDAAKVTDALAQKDYEGAVSSYAKLKESVTTPEQETDYAALSRQLRSALFDASSTDPKAAEALQAFRVMTTGR